jgi:uncharacterized protein YbbC (DUF1343 family)
MVSSPGLDNQLAALQGNFQGAPAGPAGTPAGLIEQERLMDLAGRLRAGARCGLVCNLASVDSRLRDSASALLDAGASLAALFGPEHGLRGAAGPGDAVAGESGPGGTPVFSLYGASTAPAPEMLDGLDIMIFDLQDAGVRFYTYIWTMARMMEACAARNLPFVVLDRPNPLGGMTVEGPPVQPGMESFLGLYSTPILHGMTLGEMARFFAGRHISGCPVQVCPIVGWRREMAWPGTGLDWAPPSPNLPTAESALIYPATCLLEGTNLSAGRGTALPFRSFGAPWVNPFTLASALRERTGHRWRPLYFTPTASKHAGQVCAGVEWHPPQQAGWMSTWRPVKVGLQIVQVLMEMWPGEFQWLGSGARRHFDLLMGDASVRERLDRGETAEAIAAGWAVGEQAFARERQPALLY